MSTSPADRVFLTTTIDRLSARIKSYEAKLQPGQSPDFESAPAGSTPLKSSHTTASTPSPTPVPSSPLVSTLVPPTPPLSAQDRLQSSASLSRSGSIVIASSAPAVNAAARLASDTLEIIAPNAVLADEVGRFVFSQVELGAESITLFQATLNGNLVASSLMDYSSALNDVGMGQSFLGLASFEFRTDANDAIVQPSPTQSRPSQVLRMIPIQSKRRARTRTNRTRPRPVEIPEEIRSTLISLHRQLYTTEDRTTITLTVSTSKRSRISTTIETTNTERHLLLPSTRLLRLRTLRKGARSRLASRRTFFSRKGDEFNRSRTRKQESLSPPTCRILPRFRASPTLRRPN